MKNDQIYVGGLPSCSSKRTVVILTNYFSNFGYVKDVFIPKHKNGFAFVKFADDGTAKEVCKTDKHEIYGKMVRLCVLNH